MTCPSYSLGSGTEHRIPCLSSLASAFEIRSHGNPKAPDLLYLPGEFLQKVIAFTWLVGQGVIGR